MTRAELIEALETAQGADSTLDGAIFLLSRPNAIVHGHTYTEKGDEVGNVFGFLPRYTESIDAAMMLVPEGAWFVVKNVMGPQPLTSNLFVADVLVEGGKDRPIQLTRPCATPALALAAACLRAGGE